MAQKKKSENQVRILCGRNIAMMFLAVGIFLFVPISVFAALYFTIRCLFLPKEPSVEYLYPEGEISVPNIAAIQWRLSDVLGIGRDSRLPLRQGGRFDPRPPLGRELNAELDKLDLEIDDWWVCVGNLEDEAARRLQVWSFNRAARAASFMAVRFLPILVLLPILGFPTQIYFILIVGGVSVLYTTMFFFSKKRSFLKEYAGSLYYVREQLAEPALSYIEQRNAENNDESEREDEQEEYTDWQSQSEGNQQAPQPPEEDSQTAFDILGVRSDASLEEIKAAYRAAIKQYHPDFVANLGPELRDLAEKKTKELNTAYDTAKQSAQSK